MEWHGSVENRMDEGKQVGALRVGMGATETMHSDREPYTVQKVVGPSRAIVAEDKWTRVDSNGRSERREHACESVPLTVGEKKRRCTHMPFMQIGTDRCDDRGETDGCGGWKRLREAAPANGATLVETKRGRKALGQDRRFAPGIREKCEDPTFWEGAGRRSAGWRPCTTRGSRSTGRRSWNRGGAP